MARPALLSYGRSIHVAVLVSFVASCSGESLLIPRIPSQEKGPGPSQNAELVLPAGVSLPSPSNGRAHIRLWARGGTLLQDRDLSREEIIAYSARLRTVFTQRAPNPSRALPVGAGIRVSDDPSAVVEVGSWSSGGSEYSLFTSTSASQVLTTLYQDAAVLNTGFYSYEPSGDSTLVTAVTYQGYDLGELVSEVTFPSSALADINAGGGLGNPEPELDEGPFNCLASLAVFVAATIALGVAVAAVVTSGGLNPAAWVALAEASAAWIGAFYWVLDACFGFETSPPSMTAEPAP